MILLDIDDTLVDHSTAERTGAELFGAHFAASIPAYDEVLFASRWHRALERHYAAFLMGEISFQEQRRRRLRDIFRNEDMPDSKADELFNVYLRFYEDSWQLFPDVLPFLEANREHGFGVISDGAHEQQMQKLRNQGIDGYMQFVITAESVGLCKPDPRMFHRACEVAGAAPATMCYIGDNLKKDALGATAAGLRGIWLNRNSAPVPEGVESITSLKEYTPNKSFKRTAPAP